MRSTLIPFCVVLSWLAVGALVMPVARASDWPQWLGPNREGVWREAGLLETFPPGGPKVLWRQPIGGGYSGPAVVSGRVYVMDRERATDADGKPLRATRDGLPGNERVLCLSAADGKLIWKHEYDCPYRISYASGPRTTPIVRDGRVYTLGAMGDLCCLDADTGKVRWSENLAKKYKLDPPVWGWSSNPLLDGDLLYCLVGGEGSAVVAFHKDTGKEVWKALTAEEVAYSPPMMIEAGGQRQLIVWHSESINALDPATGKVFWTQTYPLSGAPQRPSVNIATPRLLGDLLFITSFYHGPLMLKLAADKPTATVLWQDKSKSPSKLEGLHSLMPTPVLKDGYIYGVSANGELSCCEAATGKQLWETYAATGGKKTDCGTAFLVPQGDRFILFNDQGELILAHLTPQEYKEIDRARILEPTEAARGRQVVWSHPAFAERCVFARNNKEIVCVSLAKDQQAGTGQRSPAATVSKGLAKDSKPPVAASLDKKAVEIVKQAGVLIKEAKAFHAEADLASTVEEGDKKDQINIAATYDVAKPNQFAMRTQHAKDKSAGVEVVCDGKYLFVHGRRLKQYTEEACPGILTPISQKLLGLHHPNTGMLFPNLLTDDPAETLLDGVTACSYVGLEKVSGQAAHHLQFKQPEFDWDLWVAAEDKPFVLKMSSLRASDEHKTVTVETYKNWKLEPAAGEGVFVFSAPADAKKVKTIAPRRSDEG